jgi:hypothetical protein
MPGTLRGYTLSDILGQLNEQSSAFQGSIVPLQGFFNSTNENTTITGTFTTSVGSNPTWDNGTWGMVTWG